MREHLGPGAMIVSFAMIVACSSGSSGAAGDGSASATLSGHDANPDGVPYPAPASGFGKNKRTGTTPGNVMANFKFRGYPNDDMSKGLQTIALADFYDPCGKRYKMVHLSVAGLWCEACSEETDALVGAKAELATEKIVVLQAVDDGTMQNVPATMADLDHWVAKHQTSFSEVLDPGLQNFAGFFSPSAIPWNCDLDPRTMEIIDESIGWSGNVSSETHAGLAAIPASPSYPVPSCP